MRYTLPRSYANAGVAVDIPEEWLQAKRRETKSTKTAIDTWLIENGYASEAECGLTNTAPSTNTRKREKKVDATKADLVKKLADFLTEELGHVDVVNPERLIAFAIGDDNYELTLARKRRPKK